MGVDLCYLSGESVDFILWIGDNGSNFNWVVTYTEEIKCYANREFEYG